MDIVHDPDEILRKKLSPITQFNASLRKIVDEMKKSMVAHEGVGLSANQVGLDMALFIARPKEKFYVFINPDVELIGEADIKEEGCLSIPGTWGITKRVKKIRIKYQNLEGKKRTLTTEGFLAHIIQHEYDHITGVLFTDNALELFDTPKPEPNNESPELNP